MSRHSETLALGLGLCLVAAGLVACTALRLNERYVALGDVIEVGERGGDRAPEDVRVFLRSAPPGFDWVAGRVEVQPGYRHRMLGRIELHLDAGMCDGSDAGLLGRQAVVAQLRRRTARVGGDAVVYVQTRAEDTLGSDCERLEAAGGRVREEPWAVGWAVLLEDELPDAGAADPGLADAGVAYPSGDAGRAFEGPDGEGASASREAAQAGDDSEDPDGTSTAEEVPAPPPPVDPDDVPAPPPAP